MQTALHRVALVTCAAYPDLHEDDRLLIPAFERLGFAVDPTVWSDPTVDWSSFDALVIRSPWDYFERSDEFQAWLDARAASGVLMCNSAAILEWNYDKRYLVDLEAAGVSVVPSIYVAPGERADVAARVAAHGWEEIVVKPTISGGAYRTHRFRVADAERYASEIDDILTDRGLLIQPFLPEIVRDGELSMLFFDGVFSHAVRKRAKSGEYRVQIQFGGKAERAEVDAALVEQARACVLSAPSLPVYARVDGLVVDGSFLLMELEVFEPLLYLATDSEAPARFARAVKGRLLDGPA